MFRLLAAGERSSALLLSPNVRWLTASGCDVPFSRTDGSAGGAPSIAHRLLSYLDRMNDSILL